MSSVIPMESMGGLGSTASVLREALEEQESVDYTRGYVSDCVAKCLLGVGIAFGECLLFSYGIKNWDILPPHYGNMALFLLVAVGIPSIACAIFSKPHD